MKLQSKIGLTIIFGIFLIIAILITPFIQSKELTLTNEINETTIFTKLIKSEADLTGGYAEWVTYFPDSQVDMLTAQKKKYKNVFNVKFIGGKNPHNITSWKLFVKEIASKQVPTYNRVWINKTCIYDKRYFCFFKETCNLTKEQTDMLGKEYDCSYWNTTQNGTRTVYYDVLIPIKDYEFEPMTKYNIILKAEWSPSFGDHQTDWIPEITLDGTITKDAKTYKLSRDEWAWWNTSWSYCRNITMPASKISSDLSDFPMMLKLNSSRIDYSNTQNSGEDIRIVNAPCNQGGSTVPHEIEEWNESGDSFVWFKVSSLSSTTDTVYSYYYGNAGVADSQNSTGLWNDYVGVWHMTETNAIDSKYNHNGTASGNVAQTTGQISTANDFDGASDYILLGEGGGDFDFGTEDFSISLWIKSTDTNIGYLIGKWDSNGATHAYFIDVNEQDEVCFEFKDGTNSYFAKTTTDVTDGTWHLISGVREGTDIKLYVDKNLEITVAIGSGKDADNDIDLILGMLSGFSTWSYDGIEDEVRLYNSSYSFAWVNATYDSETDNIITYGSEETPAGNSAPTVTLVSPVDNYNTSDTTPDFTFTPTDDSDSNVSCQLFINGTGYGINSTTWNNTQTTITANATLSDGSHYWYINCTDSDSTVGQSETRSITIDTTAPTISFSSNSTTLGNHAQDYIYFCVDIIESSIDTVGYSFDGTNSTTWDANYCKNKTGLSDGDYVVYLWANDTTSHYSQTSSRTISLDTIKPNIVMTSPQNISYTTSSISLNYWTSETMDWVGYSLNGASNVTITGNTTITATQGSNSIYICGNDSANNMNCTETVYFSVDSINPTVVIYAPTGQYNDTAAIPINFTATDTNLDSCWYNYNGTDTILPSCANTTISVPNGTYTMYVYANDTFGNQGSDSSVFESGWNEIAIVEPNPPTFDTEPQSPIEGDILDITNITAWTNQSIEYSYGDYYYKVPAYTIRNYTKLWMKLTLGSPCALYNYSIWNFDTNSWENKVTGGGGSCIFNPTDYTFLMDINSSHINGSGYLRLSDNETPEGAINVSLEFTPDDFDYRFIDTNGSTIQDWSNISYINISYGMASHIINVSARAKEDSILSDVSTTQIKITNINITNPENGDIIIGSSIPFTFNLTAQDEILCYEYIDSTQYNLSYITEGIQNNTRSVTTYDNHTYTVSCVSNSNSSLTYNESINFTNHYANWSFTLYNEDYWNKIFDSTGANITLTIYCSEDDNTYIYDFNDSYTDYIPIECNVDYVQINVNYNESGYTRSLVPEGAITSNVSIYLADAFAYTILKTPFFMSDYNYYNSLITFYKQSNGTEYTITEGYFDIVHRFYASLKQDNNYYIRITKGSQVRELTYYFAADSSQQDISISTINLQPNSGLTLISGNLNLYGEFIDNTTLQLHYEDKLNDTEDITITIYEGLNETPVYNNTFTGLSDFLVNINGLNKSKRYSVAYSINHGTLGNSPVKGVFGIGDFSLFDLGLNSWLYMIFSFTILVMTSLLIIPKTRLFGYISLLGEMGVLTYIGWAFAYFTPTVAMTLGSIEVVLLALGIAYDLRRGSGE